MGLLVLLLFDEIVHAIHDLRNHVDYPVHGVAGRRSDVYHPDGALFDDEEADRLDLDAGGVAAAVGSSLPGLLAGEFNSAAAEAEAGFSVCLPDLYLFVSFFLSLNAK